MSPDAEVTANAKATLRRVGAGPDSGFELAEAALALAALDRPHVALEHYRDHLDEIVRDVAAASDGDSLAHCIAGLNGVLFDRFGYQGDRLTYDDLQNANLMRVIDRRKGLPIALGILTIHAARGQGWSAAGLAFPGHFLVRLDCGGERAIIDPFNGGRVATADDLRDLLKAMHGAEAELAPAHYAAVSDREILLRLQNNIKLRLLQLDKADEAAAVAEIMLLFAPAVNPLRREAGLLHAHAGNLQAAVDAFEAFLEHETRDGPRHEVAAFLQRLRRHIN